jgi:hypothetical protein
MSRALVRVQTKKAIILKGDTPVPEVLSCWLCSARREVEYPSATFQQKDHFLSDQRC